MSDFEDDEDFGLSDSKPTGACIKGVEAVAAAEAVAAVEAVAEEEDDDIYGDIVAPSKALQNERTAGSASSSAPIKVEAESESERQLALVERQNSGNLAASSTRSPNKPPPSNQPQRKGMLPKILADTTIVYVGELEWWTSDVELETICAEFGSVDSLTFFEDKASGKSKGYCLVKFTTKEAANLCRHQMHGMVINGRKCVVTFSNNKNASAQSGRQQMNAHPSTAPRGPHYNVQGRDTGWSHISQPEQLDSSLVGDFPPLPPWGMASLPMPGGLAMPPFMDLGNQASEADYKRRRY